MSTQRERVRGETGGRHSEREREREREREHACCRCSFTCTLFLMPSISSNTLRSMDCRYLPIKNHGFVRKIAGTHYY
jgi:hypothetical protein